MNTLFLLCLLQSLLLLGVKCDEDQKKIWSTEGCQSVMPPSLPVLKVMHAEIRNKVAQNFRNTFGDGIIFIYAGTPRSRVSYRQESNFLYLTGIEYPNYALAIDVLNSRSILFAPYYDEDYALWNGEVLTLEQITELYGPDAIFYDDEISNVLNDITNNQERTIYLLPDHTLPDFTNVNNTALSAVLAASRVIKTASEIALIRLASKVSSDAHINLMKDSAVGLFEYNYGGYFQYYTISCGLIHYAYPPIVGSGNRSAILHYRVNQYQTINGDFILIDAGAEYRGYGCDITRTFPVNGRFSPAQTLIYQMVLNVVNDIESILRPGLLWADMQTRASQSITAALLEAGLVRGSMSELIANRIWTYFYPHNLGHSVGLDVHDPGFNGVVQENMILTVEPGIYFNKAFMLKGLNDTIARNYMVADKILPYVNSNFGGVRIEDTVVVTSTGIEVLSVAPKTINDIEEIMNQ